MQRPVVTLIGLICTSALLTACSGDSSGTNSGGGGGGRAFVSGDLNAAQSFTHVFAAAGSFPYYCKYHGGPGGAGMSGTITVTAGGTPSRVNLTIVNSSTLPTTTVDVLDTVVWTNNTSVKHTVESDN